MERKRSTRRYRYRAQRSLPERCKDYVRKFVAFMFCNVGIIGLVIAYTIAGAFMFMYIEGTDPLPATTEMGRLRNETVQRLWQLTCELNPFAHANWTSAVAPELELYQRKVVELVRQGFDASGTARRQWTFSGAFLYSLTVITTIGYGNVAPKTDWGKISTIVYAIIGMPLFLLYLSNIGDILARSFKWTYSEICLCRGCLRGRRPRARAPPPPPSPPWQTPPPPSPPVEELRMHTQELGDEESDSETDDSSDVYDPQAVTVPVTLCLAIMVGYVCGGALLFSGWESWDFLDGSYFCFISLSTIGFGDIVPGDQIYSEGINLSFIFCSMYLMLGMALIAMCFNLMQEEVVHKIRSYIRAIKNCFGCR